MANGDGFNQAVQGLLGNPALATGIGLLSGALDRRPVGQTLLQGLQLGQSAAGQSARNDLLRQRMRQQQAQQQSGARLAELFASLGQPTGPVQLTGPDVGQRTTPPQVDPALAQVGAELARSGDTRAAAQLATGLLAPAAEERRTSLQRNLEAAGIDPSSQLGRELVIRSVIGQDTTGALAGVQAQLAQIELQNKQLAAEEKRRQFQAEERTEARQQADLRSDLLVQQRNLLEASGIIGDLEGSFAEPGQFSRFTELGLGAVGFLGEQLGFDTEAQQDLVSKAQRFRQLATTSGVDQFRVFEARLLTGNSARCLTTICRRRRRPAPTGWRLLAGLRPFSTRRIAPGSRSRIARRCGAESGSCGRRCPPTNAVPGSSYSRHQRHHQAPGKPSSSISAAARSARPDRWPKCACPTGLCCDFRIR